MRRVGCAADARADNVYPTTTAVPLAQTVGTLPP
jgi:hypothetical protein